MKHLRTTAIDLDAVHGGMRWFPWDRESTNVEDRRPQSQGGPVPDHDWQREQRELDPHYTPPQPQQQGPAPRDDDRSGRGAPQSLFGDYRDSSESASSNEETPWSGGDPNGNAYDPYASMNDHASANESASNDYASADYSSMNDYASNDYSNGISGETSEPSGTSGSDDWNGSSASAEE